MDRNKLATFLMNELFAKEGHDSALFTLCMNAVDGILSLLAPEIEKAQDADKFINACRLNPFHGYITCLNCFFRLTCAKKKIEVKDGQ